MPFPAPFKLIKPCDNCPFRKDIRPYLRKERVVQIANDCQRGTFDCHKTVTYGKGAKSRAAKEALAHCAGLLIVLEKSGRPSQMMRIGERLGLYDPTKLDMTAPVFDSIEEAIDAQDS